jgi:hypothetical protein
MWGKEELHILCPPFLLRDESNETFPHCFIADKAFLLKVKPRRMLTNRKHIFDYRLSCS